MANKKVIFASRPVGEVDENTLKVVDADETKIADGEILIEVHFASVDPYIRGRLREGPSYVPPFNLNDTISCGIVGEVVESKNDKFKKGVFVSGNGDFQNFTKSNGEGFNIVDEKVELPLSYYLGVLGMPGLTAYAGLTRVAEIKEGDNVFVSAASGAVGLVVGQIAKNKGCYVVGSVGSDDKVALCKDVGFDQVFNYKTTKPEEYTAKLKELFPNGIDAYCLDEVSTVPRNLSQILVKGAKMQGFLVFHHFDLAPEWGQQAAEWFKNGKLKYKETVSEGIDTVPKAFLDLMQGKNIGKQIIKFKV